MTRTGPCVPDVVPSLVERAPSLDLILARREEARLRRDLDAHRRAIGEIAAQLGEARARREALERAEARDA